MKININYKRFEKALENEKLVNFAELKKDISDVKLFFVFFFAAAMESSQTKIEREYNICSL